jgi:hypothetical protein
MEVAGHPIGLFLAIDSSDLEWIQDSPLWSYAGRFS